MGLIRIPQLILPFDEDLGLLRKIMVRIINGTQGISLFIIFICNKKILHALNNKIYPSYNLFGNSETETNHNVTEQSNITQITNLNNSSTCDYNTSDKSN